MDFFYFYYNVKCDVKTANNGIFPAVSAYLKLFCCIFAYLVVVTLSSECPVTNLTGFIAESKSPPGVHVSKFWRSISGKVFLAVLNTLIGF